jgi:hypothetical protein
MPAHKLDEGHHDRHPRKSLDAPYAARSLQTKRLAASARQARRPHPCTDKCDTSGVLLYLVSQGIGAVQRFILHTLDDTRSREGFSPFVPLPTVAALYAIRADRPNTPGPGMSLRRATAGLVGRGLVL